MNAKKFLVLFSFILLVAFVNSGDNTVATLKYKDGKIEQISVKEFEKYFRYYSPEIDSSKFLSFLESYIEFKLKLAEGLRDGIDKEKEIVDDFKNYTNQNAILFPINKLVIEPLVEETYNRSKEEINASHILISVPEKSSPKDTLAAYNKVIDIRKQILNGLSFDTAAYKYSGDPSAKNNFGKLGFFSINALVAPFENAAYSLKIGEISGPVRTTYGYHLIKVLAKRPIQSIRLSHILIRLPLKTNEKDSIEAYFKANNILEQLKKGMTFEQAAKNYSEDPRTSQQGGDIGRASKGEISVAEIDKASFELQKEGDISGLVRSPFGLHILKLTEKSVKPLSEVKEKLKQDIINNPDKIKSKIKSIIIDIQKTITLKRNKEIWDTLYKTFKTPSTVAKADSLLANYRDKELISIGKLNSSVKDFLDYMKLYKKNEKATTKDVTAIEDEFLDIKYIQYKASTLKELQKENEDLSENYKNGLVVFAQMQKKVLDKAQVTMDEIKIEYDKIKDKIKTEDKVKIGGLEFFTLDEANSIYDELTNKKRTRDMVTAKDVAQLKKKWNDSLKTLNPKNASFKEKQTKFKEELATVKLDIKNRSFADLEKVYSLTESSFINQKKTSFAKGEMEQINDLFLQKNGFISNPFFHNRKFYILTRKDFEKSRPMTLEEATEAIGGKIQEVKQEAISKEWISSLKNNCEIIIDKRMLKQAFK